MSNISAIFKAYDIRGKVGTELSLTLTSEIGKAFSDWLPSEGAVAVGRDMRPDSEDLATSLIQGLLNQGRDVWDMGQVTSDMIYFAVGKYNLAGGAVVTASHNPGSYNGIKLYRDHVIAVGLDSGLDQIRDAVIMKQFKSGAVKKGTLRQKLITPDWVNHCLKFISKLEAYHIAIDTGNGMAGAILPSILPKLPLNVERLFFELDGSFPNHEANPQKPENLQDLTKIVKDKKLDFGIAFDGDGDRAAFVDDLGRPVLGTDLISIVAKYYLKKYPGAKIVHDVRTSRATEELIKEWGGQPVRTKAGRVNIGSLMRQIGAPFGGETTGHFFFKENYDADAGLITALVVMQALSDSRRKLSELVDEYRRYAMIPEMNLETSENPQYIFERLESLFSEAKIDKLDGLTIWYPDYWFNLRSSNTEPVMRLNAEAKNQELLDKLIKKITSAITKSN